MKAHVAYLVRLKLSPVGYPTMESILGRLNWLYNQALENRRTACAYGERKQSLSFYDQCKWLTKLPAANEHGLGEIAVGAGRGVLKRIDLAFQAFLRRGRARLRGSRDTGPSAAVGPSTRRARVTAWSASTTATIYAPASGQTTLSGWRP